jgi:hypothetical protein
MTKAETMLTWEYKEVIFYDEVKLKDKSGLAVSVDGEAFSFLEGYKSKYSLIN